jgi:hypothetical protein
MSRIRRSHRSHLTPGFLVFTCSMACDVAALMKPVDSND